ncbi:uncharacterized protein LOC142242574 [Haematobia irritans]|uniref:uncharacterized protein LOC142242574 n=1 Tax=Haematobia irritans TaxID=7368 RepID=UPI003F4FF447
MKTFLAIVCMALVASALGKPAYNYQQPPRQQPSGGSGGGGSAAPGNFKQQNFRPSQPVSNSGVFSVVQSPPLTSFSQGPVAAPAAVSAPAPISVSQPAPAPVNLPGPAPQALAPAQAPPSVAAPAQFAQQFSAPSNQYIPPAPQQQHFAAPSQQQQQFAAPIQQQQQFAAPIPQQQQYAAPQQQYAAAPQQQQQYAAPQQQYQPINYQPQQPQQQTIISKDIYIHSAPEEVEEIGNEAGAGQAAGPIRKNYRIVFIKAPSQNVKLNLDALKRAQASNEEKTVIYVLSKKPDFGDIQSQLAAVQNEQKSHKPEVFFIKYKTQEEANRAQQEIQAQYDSLGGSTHISDEGIAPVTSVIGGNAVNVGGTAGFAQQQQFVQQSFQSSGGVPAATYGAPPQKYFTAKKK